MSHGFIGSSRLRLTPTKMSSESNFLESLPKAIHHRTLGALINYMGQFKGEEYTFQLAQALLLNMPQLSGDTGFAFVVTKCVELLRKLPDPDGHMKKYINQLECCTRPPNAPNYDALSIRINGETPGLSYSTWKGSDIQSISDVYGPIDKKYWGKAIQEYGDIMTMIRD
jgi:hypothetical protein